MSDLRISLPRSVSGGVSRSAILAGGVFALSMAAFLTDLAMVRFALLSAAITLLAMLGLISAFAIWSRLQWRATDAQCRTLFADDPQPAIVTDRDGWVVWRNAAASGGQGVADGVPIFDALAGETEQRDTIAMLLETCLLAGTTEASFGDGPIRVTRIAGDRLVWRLSDTRRNDLTGMVVRADSDDQIVWLSPDLRSRLDPVPTTLTDLFADAPGAGEPGRELTLRSGTLPVSVASRDLPDDLRELTLDPGPRVADDGRYESLPVPLLEIGRDGTICRSNTAARTLLSIDATEMPTFQSLVEGLGRQVGDWLSDAFDGRVRGRPEIMRASRASGDLYIQVTLQQSGDSDRLIAVLHDATELKTLEAQFVQSQKMQAIGQLAGGVAHDFNNLLTAISGHCDLLLLRHEPTDQNFADLEQINQNASRAASLVGQLLAFSRKQNLRPEYLDLRDILADLTHLLNRLVGERTTLSFSHDPALKMVRADKRQLEQVIMNLVVNARDAMPEGGRISVTTRMLRLDEPEQHDRVAVPAGTYVLVEVHDHGTGIPQDKLQKIFEPFYTTKKTGEGTGLGLSTAYGIIKQTGGYIFARSRPGDGTTFALYFPAVDSPRIAPKPAPAAPIAPRKKRQGRVLLVEDEAPVRAFAVRALQMHGYDVIEAEHGEAALDIALDISIGIDIFVTDVIMPGLDGPGWVQRALELRPGMPVIFVSGYAEESFAEDQAAIPNSRFLGKPFSLQDLTRAVDAELT